MSFVFHLYILGVMSWIWTSATTEGLKFETTSKWNSCEGFNLEHWSQELWPWNCESPKEIVQRPSSQHTSNIMKCGNGPLSVVWSHMWLGPSTNCSFNEIYSRTHDRIEWINNCENLECHGLWLSVRTISKRRFLKIIQVTMKRDPLDSM
jgi:hypothetical protein